MQIGWSEDCCFDDLHWSEEYLLLHVYFCVLQFMAFETITEGVWKTYPNSTSPKWKPGHLRFLFIYLYSIFLFEILSLFFSHVYVLFCRLSLKNLTAALILIFWPLCFFL